MLERINRYLEDERIINNIIKDIIAEEFLIDVTIDQVETCFLMKIERFVKELTVSNPVDVCIYNLYLDAHKILDEQYYILFNYVTGTRQVTTMRLERDIEDVWSTEIRKFGEAKHLDCKQTVCISKSKEQLEQLKYEMEMFGGSCFY